MHYMKVCSQLHSPVAFTSGKGASCTH